MSDQATNALIAIALGSVLAVVLLVPVAAVQYRLDGRLGPTDLAVLLTAAIYALALWTYTLLPVPPAGDYACQGAQLDPLGSLRLVRGPGEAGWGSVLRQPAFLQIALNVLLFVPLGWFVRVVLKRGVVVATVLGLAASLLIEVTQRTGVWGLYDCPYRLFDVDDLLVNTVGAAVGSLLSALVVRRRRGEAPPLPTSITLGRRLVGFVSDVLFVAMLGATCALAYRAVHLYVLDRPLGRLDLGLQGALQWGVPFAVEALMVLVAGRTVGEAVISVRPVARRPALALPGRAVKLGTGIAPLFLLGVSGEVVPRPVALALLPAYAALTLLVAWRSTEHRGLSHVLAGMDLRIGGRAD
ncbi:VanZ family protein [Nocardioides sp. SYSU D00038]|uniref:VanZ family protein n=1 Tax=Nocardioides sp. SYSU D00038 TaxID=2812554 RepID=UPI001967DC5A|nr:VanZ family protein [Nocardioides sp. SYSU D00038]